MANMATSCAAVACVLLLLLEPSLGQAQQAQLETARVTERNQRLEFASAFKFTFSTVVGAARVNNSAVLQLQWDKGNDQFLSTLPAPGQSQFLTVLKPCGLLLPHVHQRATEFYSIMSGTMSAGIAQENGGAQNITLQVMPGEVFTVPQGLLHFNSNPSCTPLVFFQTFNNADPGALNVVGALAALGGAAPLGAAAIKASFASGVAASPQGAFGLDPACLTACGWANGAAPGDGLTDLPAPFRAMFGLPGGAVTAASG